MSPVIDDCGGIRAAVSATGSGMAPQMVFRRTLRVSLLLALIGCYPELDPNSGSEEGGTANRGGASGKGGKGSESGGAIVEGGDRAGPVASAGEPSAGEGTDGGAGGIGGSSAAQGGARSSSGGSRSQNGGAFGSGGTTLATGGVVAQGGEGDGPEPSGHCLPARSSYPLRARSGVISGAQQSSDQVVFTRDVWQKLDRACGNCHRETNSGGFYVDQDNFSQVVTRHVVAVIKSDDPSVSMPQGDNAQLFRERPPTDPIVQLVADLELWMDNGSPPDHFRIPKPVGAGDQYLMSPDVGDALTTVGSCIPEATFPFAWGQAYKKQMKALDDEFASLQAKPLDVKVPGEQQLGLPLHLSETDLISYDSEELARYGVIAFAPAYPLWSDESGKLRHVRVPLGKSIQFDPAKQEFVIPPNTRFYKTFLKEITDRAGGKRFRKIETRLIVSRPDRTDIEGPDAVTSLFGTYVWNEDETDASLLLDPLRDQTVFKDRLLTYPIDEPALDSVLHRACSSDSDCRALFTQCDLSSRTCGLPTNLTYALEGVKATRHYAIPGKDRCLQCHMGSVRGDFVLGFTPLQIWRRPVGQGGVIEPAGEDELNQLDRLIALGVITGLESSKDLLPLEKSQGSRTARNIHELMAQGYIFGNCAHCHNPRGYASSSAPQLKEVLKFWPGPDGGIFQFPLETFSPRIFRGVDARQIPYITPSLRDQLPFDYRNLPKGSNDVYRVKWYPQESAPEYFFEAPWRSLIYRNTQSAFTYAEDYTIFPHMPMNAGGYDPRASRLMGDWMVSIPARRKASLTKISEDEVDRQNGNQRPGSAAVDNESQPYEEVTPTDPDYKNAVSEAAARLQTFQNGVYHALGARAVASCSSDGDCLNILQDVDYSCISNQCMIAPDTSDVVDPLVEHGVAQGHDPIPTDTYYPKDNVPDHAHWVVTDLTEKPGDYAPRGKDWIGILRDGKFQPPPKDAGANEISKQEAEKHVVALLTGRDYSDSEQLPAPTGPGITFDQKLLDFISRPFPLAVWKSKPACDFSAAPLKDQVKRKGEYSEDEQLLWFKKAFNSLAAPADDAPIFSKLPGGIIYDTICINCHGPAFDSKGRQADTVALLSGGDARVANFKEKLFGPSSDPGENRGDAFGPLVTGSVSADDWGARYMSWMALGGTKAHIPNAVLQLISLTDVAGTRRKRPLIAFEHVSANMLAAGEQACVEAATVVQNATVDFRDLIVFSTDPEHGALIQSNGEAEMWQRLCTINNPIPVAAMRVDFEKFGGGASVHYADIFDRGSYPSVPVGNHLRRVDPAGITDSNLRPWCVQKAADPENDQSLEDWRNQNLLDGQPPPYCADSAVSLFANKTPEEINAISVDLNQRISQRGAINAGFAVFYYLDQVLRGKTSKLRYDECDQLKPASH